MIKRTIEPFLRSLINGYPVISITGPRQSGKTTLARMVFNDRPYVSLENPDTLLEAESDTRSFLKRYEQGAVFDEAQRCPRLFSFLQQIVDEGEQNCRFVLTGSGQFSLKSVITQSLAGRVANVTLLPFSRREWYGSGTPILEEVLYQGLYPPVLDRAVAPSTWYANYIQTYIERDLRQLASIQDLRTFHLFLRMCAARAGQLLNLSSLAADCGIAVNTAKAWISILEASFVVFLLQPHFRNFGKRLIKSPKLYFHDTGLMAYLLGIDSPEALAINVARGQLFETFVAGELRKEICNSGRMETLYFWRSIAGHEVDAIIEKNGLLHAVEMKSGKTIGSDFFSSLLEWEKTAGDSAGQSFLVYGGDEGRDQGRIKVLPWRSADEIVSMCD